MRISQPLLDAENAQEAASSCAAVAIRTITERLEQIEAETHPLPGEVNTGLEKILLDVQLNSSRYLLVRMPRPVHDRVQLSPREHEIVRMVAQGHPNKVIADVLNINSWTVCTHLRRIFAKLGVGSRAAMVARMLEIGVLSREHRTLSHQR